MPPSSTEGEPHPERHRCCCTRRQLHPQSAGVIGVLRGFQLPVLRAHLRAHGWRCGPCLPWGTPGRLARLGARARWASACPPSSRRLLDRLARLLRGEASRPKPGNVQAHLQELASVQCLSGPLQKVLQGRLSCNVRSVRVGLLTSVKDRTSCLRRA